MHAVCARFHLVLGHLSFPRTSLTTSVQLQIRCRGQNPVIVNVFVEEVNVPPDNIVFTQTTVLYDDTPVNTILGTLVAQDHNTVPIWAAAFVSMTPCVFPNASTAFLNYTQLVKPTFCASGQISLFIYIYIYIYIHICLYVCGSERERVCVCRFYRTSRSLCFNYLPFR
jgi:hypothetical protein